MKNCIIQLKHVPTNIRIDTSGDIDEGMYLSTAAVEALIKGSMFTRLMCYWSYAGVVSEDDAELACRQLEEFHIVGYVIVLE